MTLLCLVLALSASAETGDDQQKVPLPVQKLIHSASRLFEFTVKSHGPEWHEENVRQHMEEWVKLPKKSRKNSVKFMEMRAKAWEAITRMAPAQRCEARGLLQAAMVSSQSTAEYKAIVRILNLPLDTSGRGPETDPAKAAMCAPGELVGEWVSAEKEIAISVDGSYRSTSPTSTDSETGVLEAGWFFAGRIIFERDRQRSTVYQYRWDRNGVAAPKLCLKPDDSEEVCFTKRHAGQDR